MIKVVHNSNYINIKRDPATLKKPYKRRIKIYAQNKYAPESVWNWRANIGNQFSESIEHCYSK